MAANSCQCANERYKPRRYVGMLEMDTLNMSSAQMNKWLNCFVRKRELVLTLHLM